MTWIDNNGEVRPQSWEEYLSMLDYVPEWAMSGVAYQPLHPPRRKWDNEREKVSKMRVRLYRADPHCFWCGRKTGLNLAHPHPQMATVDHLYSRLHPERVTRYREQKGVLHVLACAACNNERGVCEQQERPFIPKLAHRLSYAQRADAVLAQRAQRVPAQPVVQMRVIQTLEEAVRFARENPGR